MSKGEKSWLIISSALTAHVALLLAIRPLWGSTELWTYASALITVLVFNIFYAGYFVGLIIAAVALTHLAWRIYSAIEKRTKLSVLMVVIETLIIGINVIGFAFWSWIDDLYFMIPGW